MPEISLLMIFPLLFCIDPPPKQCPIFLDDFTVILCIGSTNCDVFHQNEVSSCLFFLMKKRLLVVLGFYVFLDYYYYNVYINAKLK